MPRRLAELRSVALVADEGRFVVSDPTGETQTFGDDELHRASAAMFELIARHAGDDGDLRRRFLAAASALSYFDAINDRDWTALLSTVEEGLVVHDHRPVGLGTVAGASTYIETLRQAVEVIPDAVWAMRDVLVLDADGRLAFELRVAGTVDGAEVEVTSFAVGTLGESGLTARFEIFALEQRDEVLALFD